MMHRQTKDMAKALEDLHPAVVVRVVRKELGDEQAEVLEDTLALVPCSLCPGTGQLAWRGGVTTCWLCEGHGRARRADVAALERSKR